MIDIFAVPAQVPGIEARIAVAIAFTAAAAYFDIFNKKWVPNYLTYGFLAAAIGVNLLFFDSGIFTQGLAFGIAIFALTYALYRMGQLGGADVYIMASIALAIPYFSSPLLAPQQSVPYPFILSVIAPTGLAFILHMVARFLPYISRKVSRGEVKFTIQKIAGPAILALAFSFFIYSLALLPFALPISYVAILSFLFVSLLFFSLFKDEIKDSMVELLPVSRLQEEDVLALEKMDKRIIAKLSLAPLLSAKTIAALKKSKLKKVPVYTGMPFFLPYLLFGLVFSLLFGDLLLYLIRV